MWFEFYPVLKEITLCLRQFFVSMKLLLLKMTLLIVVPYSVHCTVCVHSTSEAVTLIIFSSSVSITLEQLSFVLILSIQVLQYAKKSKSPHKNRACHGWSRGKGILLCPCVFLLTYIWSWNQIQYKLLHLLKPWQAWFLCGDSDLCWDSGLCRLLFNKPRTQSLFPCFGIL